MPRTRDPRYDQNVVLLLARARAANGWLTFRLGGQDGHPSTYQDRLAFQRAVFYMRRDQESVEVRWQSPEGTWERLLTPGNQAPTTGQGPRTRGTPVGRLRLHSRAAGRAQVSQAIRAGEAAYDNL